MPLTIKGSNKLPSASKLNDEERKRLKTVRELGVGTVNRGEETAPNATPASQKKEEKVKSEQNAKRASTQRGASGAVMPGNAAPTEVPAAPAYAEQAGDFYNGLDGVSGAGFTDASAVKLTDENYDTLINAAMQRAAGANAPASNYAAGYGAMGQSGAQPATTYGAMGQQQAQAAAKPYYDEAAFWEGRRAEQNYRDNNVFDNGTINPERTITETAEDGSTVTRAAETYDDYSKLISESATRQRELETQLANPENDAGEINRRIAEEETLRKQLEAEQEQLLNSNRLTDEGRAMYTQQRDEAAAVITELYPKIKSGKYTADEAEQYNAAVNSYNDADARLNADSPESGVERFGSNVAGTFANYIGGFGRAFSDMLRIDPQNSAAAYRMAGMSDEQIAQLMADHPEWFEHDDALSNAFNTASDYLANGAANLTEAGNEELAWARQNASDLAITALDISKSTQEMLMDLPFKWVGVDPTAVMALRVYGNSAESARLMGLSREQQEQMGLLSAGVEVFTEKLFGGIKIYGEGFGDAALKKLIQAFDVAADSTFGKVFFGAFGEMSEEFISGLCDPVIDYIVTSELHGVDWEETAHSMLCAGFIGGLGGGAEVINSYVNGNGAGITPEMLRATEQGRAVLQSGAAMGMSEEETCEVLNKVSYDTANALVENNVVGSTAMNFGAFIEQLNEGGIAAPSVALSPNGMFANEGYGDTDIIYRPGTFDSENVNLFGADAYTPVSSDIGGSRARLASGDGYASLNEDFRNATGHDFNPLVAKGAASSRSITVLPDGRVTLRESPETIVNEMMNNNAGGDVNALAYLALKNGGYDVSALEDSNGNYVDDGSAWWGVLGNVDMGGMDMDTYIRSLAASAIETYLAPSETTMTPQERADAMLTLPSKANNMRGDEYYHASAKEYNNTAEAASDAVSRVSLDREQTDAQRAKTDAEVKGVFTGIFERAGLSEAESAEFHKAANELVNGLWAEITSKTFNGDEIAAAQRAFENAGGIFADNYTMDDCQALVDACHESSNGLTPYLEAKFTDVATPDRFGIVVAPSAKLTPEVRTQLEDAGIKVLEYSTPEERTSIKTNAVLEYYQSILADSQKSAGTEATAAQEEGDAFSDVLPTAESMDAQRGAETEAPQFENSDAINELFPELAPAETAPAETIENTAITEPVSEAPQITPAAEENENQGGLTLQNEAENADTERQSGDSISKATADYVEGNLESIKSGLEEDPYELQKMFVGYRSAYVRQLSDGTYESGTFGDDASGFSLNENIVRSNSLEEAMAAQYQYMLKNGGEEANRMVQKHADNYDSRHAVEPVENNVTETQAETENNAAQPTQQNNTGINNEQMVNALEGVFKAMGFDAAQTQAIIDNIKNVSQRGTATNQAAQPAAAAETTAPVENNVTEAQAETENNVTQPAETAAEENAATEAQTAAPAQQNTNNASTETTEENGGGKIRERGFSTQMRNDTARAKALVDSYRNNPLYYDVLSNKVTLNRALDIMGRGMQEAYNVLSDALAAGEQGAMIQPHMVPLTKMVCDALVEDGNIEEARRLSASLATQLTLMGEVTQAASIIKGVSSDTVLRAANNICDEINRRTGRTKQSLREESNAVEKRNKTSRAVEHAVDDAQANFADEVENTAESLDGSYKDVDSKISKSKSSDGVKGLARKIVEKSQAVDERYTDNVFTFEYEDEGATMIADYVRKRANAKPKTQTLMERLVGHIRTLATENLPKVSTGQKLTSTALLAEYAANQEYANAIIEGAKTQLADEVNRNDNQGKKNNQIIRDYSESTLNIAATKLANRAVAEAAIATEENANMIRKQISLGVTESMIAERISDQLIKDTGATGGLAYDIEEAALSYVNGVVAKTKTAPTVTTAVNSAMRAIGETYRNLAVKDGTTREQAVESVAKELIKKYGFSEESAYEISRAAAEEFYGRLSEAVSKELEKRFGGKKAERETVDRTIQNLTEAINLGAFNDSAYINAAADKLFGFDKINKEAENSHRNWTAKLTQAEIDEINRTDFNKEGAYEDIMNRIGKRLGEEMPAKFSERLREWRMISMLGRPRTIIKNIFANVPTVPMYYAAHRISGAMQSLAVKAGLISEAEQTRTVATDARCRAVAKQVYDSVKEQLGEKGNSAYKPVNQTLREHRTIFKGNKRLQSRFTETNFGRGINSLVTKINGRETTVTDKAVLENARRLTYRLLELGDSPFVRTAYTESLASYLTAHEIYNINDVTEEALQHAEADAMAETYKSANMLANALNSLKGVKGVGAVVDVAVPFTTTVANVFDMMLDYFPVTGVFKTGAALATGDRVGAIEAFSKTLTGTAIVGMSAVLRMLGLITGRRDDDEDKARWDEANGIQEYSFLGKLSYDWAEPSGSLMALGASLVDSWCLAAASDDFTVLDGFVKVMLDTSDAIIGMSMLEGFASMMRGYGSVSENIASGFITSFASQLVPGLVSDLEYLIDPVKRSTYTDGNMLWQAIYKVWGLTPVAAEKLPAQINARGEEISRGDFWQRFLARVAPCNIAIGSKNAIDEEIGAVYDALLHENRDAAYSIFPEGNKTYLTAGGVKYDFTAEEMARYATVYGTEYYKALEQLMAGEDWENLSPLEKAAAMASAGDYAAMAAKDDFFNTRGIYYNSDTWDNIQNAPDPIGYYTYVNGLKGTFDSTDMSVDRAVEIMTTYGHEDEETARERAEYWGFMREHPEEEFPEYANILQGDVAAFNAGDLSLNDMQTISQLRGELADANIDNAREDWFTDWNGSYEEIDHIVAETYGNLSDEAKAYFDHDVNKRVGQLYEAWGEYGIDAEHFFDAWNHFTALSTGDADDGATVDNAQWAEWVADKYGYGTDPYKFLTGTFQAYNMSAAGYSKFDRLLGTGTVTASEAVDIIAAEQTPEAMDGRDDVIAAQRHEAVLDVAPTWESYRAYLIDGGTAKRTVAMYEDVGKEYEFGSPEFEVAAMVINAYEYWRSEYTHEHDGRSPSKTDVFMYFSMGMDDGRINAMRDEAVAGGMSELEFWNIVMSVQDNATFVYSLNNDAFNIMYGDMFPED